MWEHDQQLEGRSEVAAIERARLARGEREV